MFICRQTYSWTVLPKKLPSLSCRAEGGGVAAEQLAGASQDNPVGLILMSIHLMVHPAIGPSS